jgi:hypothetical protein
MSKVYVETVTDGSADMVIASIVHEAKPEEVEAARKAYASDGSCSCRTLVRFVVDTECYPYRLRSCAICNRSLGNV